MPNPGTHEVPGVSAGNGFPDKFGDIDDEIGFVLIWVCRCANLAGTGADDVIEPAIGLAVGQVEHRADDLAASWRVGAAIAVPLEHDGGPVVGPDDSAEIRPERPGRTLPLGKFAPRKRPVTEPSQRPSAMKNSCCQPPLRVIPQLSG